MIVMVLVFRFLEVDETIALPLDGLKFSPAARPHSMLRITPTSDSRTCFSTGSWVSIAVSLSPLPLPMII